MPPMPPMPAIMLAMSMPPMPPMPPMSMPPMPGMPPMPPMPPSSSSPPPPPELSVNAYHGFSSFFVSFNCTMLLPFFCTNLQPLISLDNCVMENFLLFPPMLEMTRDTSVSPLLTVNASSPRSSNPSIS